MISSALARRTDGTILDVAVSCLSCHSEIHFFGTPPYEPQRCVVCARVLVEAEQEADSQ